MLSISVVLRRLKPRGPGSSEDRGEVDVPKTVEGGMGNGHGKV